MCLVVWMEEEVEWYLGFVSKDIGEDKYLEYLEQHPPSQNDFWQHPKGEDVLTVFKRKIHHAELMEFGKHLHQHIGSKYHLKNSQQIKNQLTKIIK